MPKNSYVEAEEKLGKWEKETIINFNQEEKESYWFTYDKKIQQHFEKTLGIKPIRIEPEGAREYQINKNRILLPRKIRVLSSEQRESLSNRMKTARLKKEANDG